MSSIVYSNNQTFQKYNFCDGEALRAWLLSNKTAPPSPWMPPNELNTFERIISQNGGYEGGLQWYKAIVNNINNADEASASGTEIGIPVLVITAKNDPVGPPESVRMGTKPYAQDYTEKGVDSGHFVQLEKSEEVNGYLKDFLVKILGNGTKTG
jgi:pimeloyl-ACP methyl ester carboxylesterase